MKAFMEEYGFSILAVVIAIILIDMCTPVGKIVRNAASNVIGTFFNKEKVSYTVSLFTGNGKFDDGKTVKVLIIDENQEIGELPIPVKEGYVFSGWWDDSYGGKEYIHNSTINEDTKLYAHWKTGNHVNSGHGMYDEHLYINNVDMGVFKEKSEFKWKNYDWIVLNIENNTALIVSKDVLDKDYSKNIFNDGVKFNTPSNFVLINSKEISNCYKDSWLDAYMEGFYSILNDEAIVESAISIGLYNSEYAYTTSTVARHIFALSYSETKQYLESDSKRIAYNNDFSYSYWTRSGVNTSYADGEINYEAYAVFSDGSFINNEIESRIGARPAMYIDLTKINGVQIY